MRETRLQKRRRQMAEQIVSWFPTKSAKNAKLLTDAHNRRIDKKKGFTARKPQP